MARPAATLVNAAAVAGGRRSLRIAQHGGRGTSSREQMIYTEELARVDAPAVDVQPAYEWLLAAPET